jgi:hypothetical protein
VAASFQLAVAGPTRARRTAQRVRRPYYVGTKEHHNQRPAEPRTQRSGGSGRWAVPLTALEDSLRARLGLALGLSIFLAEE